MDCYQNVKDFLKPAELSRLRKIVYDKIGEAHETSGKKGLGPRYRVIDGDQIRSMLPEVWANTTIPRFSSVSDAAAWGRS